MKNQKVLESIWISSYHSLAPNCPGVTQNVSPKGITFHFSGYIWMMSPRSTFFAHSLITFTASFSLSTKSRERKKMRARSRIKPLPSHVKKGHIYWERRIPWTQIVFYFKSERDLWTRDPPLEDAGQSFNGANKKDKLIEKKFDLIQS